MKNYAVLIFAILISIGCSQKRDAVQTDIKVAKGKVERLENFESQYVTPRNIDIWLPEGYDNSQKYDVLYMHDGQMLYDSTKAWNGQEWGVDETISALVESGTINPCIVVGMWNGDTTRHSDYFPQKPFESLPQKFQDSLLADVSRHGGEDLFRIAVRSDGYLKFITEEVKPFIDQNYSTNPEKESTFIAGSSMGGLISMYAICEYPDVFSGAACLSTHWPGIFVTENNPIPEAFVKYLYNNLPEPDDHKIYFDYGTETLDAMYEPYQLMADSVMNLREFDSDNWITRKFEGAAHTEIAWQERLDIPLSFIMGK